MECLLWGLGKQLTALLRYRSLHIIRGIQEGLGELPLIYNHGLVKLDLSFSVKLANGV